MNQETKFVLKIINKAMENAKKEAMNSIEEAAKDFPLIKMYNYNVKVEATKRDLTEFFSGGLGGL